MTRTKQTGRNKRRKLGLKPKKKKDQKNPIKDEEDPVLFGSNPHADSDSDSDSDSSPTPDRIQRLLEPYTKDQLIGFLSDAAAEDPDLLAKIRSVADIDVSHRKVFVHGLGWDTTRETLLEAFQSFGTIEDCNVVVDKATGRAKGYGFVLFHTRSAAAKALKQPQKMIKNRAASCQLASVGPAPAGGAGPQSDVAARKIYVSNVHADAASDKLKVFFSKFGEIETGPIGFDMLTGKSRGFALFVYKTQEGARRVLEEPYKMFEGHQLHCQRATDSSQKGKLSAGVVPSLGVSLQPPVLAAVAAAQNLSLYSQNPAYGALLGQNPLLALNPTAAAAFNPTGSLIANQGQAYGVGSLGGGTPSLLGAYGSQGVMGLQGLQSYQASQFGQSSSGRPSGSFGGFPYM